MKILIIGRDASLTGASRFLLEFSKWLKNEKGCSLVMILQNGGLLAEQYDRLGKLVILHKNNSANRLERLFYRVLKINKLKFCNLWLKRSIKRQKFDLIFCNTSTNGEIIEWLNIKDVPIVSRISELGTAMKQYAKGDSVAYTLYASDRIIAVSKAVRANLIQNYNADEDKVSVIYGSLPEHYHQREAKGWSRLNLGIDDKDLVLGGCGYISWQKGTDSFIRIAKNVKKINPDLRVKFVWLGAKKDTLEFKQLWNDIRKLKLADVVMLVEPTDSPKNFMQDFDLFLMTSREDSFPLVNIEVGLEGIPIIAFRDSGGTEELLSLCNNILVDYLDEEAMAKEIIRLVDNKTLRLDLGNQLRRVVIENFRDIIVYPQIFEIFKQSISGYRIRE